MAFNFSFLEIQGKTRKTGKKKKNGIYLFLLFLSVFLKTSFPIAISSCSSPTPEEQAQADAMVAAQHGYNLLLQGDYEGFALCHEGMAEAPRSYREQMVDVYKMYIDSEQRAHRGIEKVKATRAEKDTTLNLMQVFMLISYADSTTEEIVVPVVQQQDGWKLR